MPTSGSRKCQCDKPTPRESEEDAYQLLFGSVVWVEGSTCIVCEKCGENITDPIRRLEAPKEEGRVTKTNRRADA